MIWRRSYDVPPPGGESLKDTLARTLPYYVQEILPCVLRGERTLVAAHGNSLRALIMVLEKLSPKQILARELATGVPIIYRLNADATVASKLDLARERGGRDRRSRRRVGETALDAARRRCWSIASKAAPASASCRRSRKTDGAGVLS